MKSGSRLLVSALSLVAGILIAGEAFAQTRTISTTGTSTGGGTVKITIEDFGKPDRRDLGTSSLSPQALIAIEVFIPPDYDCVQTTLAIHNALLEVLPNGYFLTIFSRDPCTIVIGCKKEATECTGWEFTEFEDNVPGQNIVPGEPGVATQKVTWSGVKARHIR